MFSKNKLLFSIIIAVILIFTLSNIALADVHIYNFFSISPIDYYSDNPNLCQLYEDDLAIQLIPEFALLFGFKHDERHIWRKTDFSGGFAFNLGDNNYLEAEYTFGIVQTDTTLQDYDYTHMIHGAYYNRGFWTSLVFGADFTFDVGFNNLDAYAGVRFLFDNAHSGLRMRYTFNFDTRHTNTNFNHTFLINFDIYPTQSLLIILGGSIGSFTHEDIAQYNLQHNGFEFSLFAGLTWNIIEDHLEFRYLLLYDNKINSVWAIKNKFTIGLGF